MDSSLSINSVCGKQIADYFLNLAHNDAKSTLYGPVDSLMLLCFFCAITQTYGKQLT